MFLHNIWFKNVQLTTLREKEIAFLCLGVQLAAEHQSSHTPFISNMRAHENVRHECIHAADGKQQSFCGKPIYIQVTAINCSPSPFLFFPAQISDSQQWRSSYLTWRVHRKGDRLPSPPHPASLLYHCPHSKQDFKIDTVQICHLSAHEWHRDFIVH